MHHNLKEKLWRNTDEGIYSLDVLLHVMQNQHCESTEHGYTLLKHGINVPK